MGHAPPRPGPPPPGLGLPADGYHSRAHRRAVLADYRRWEGRREAHELTCSAIADAKKLPDDGYRESLLRCLGERLRELGPPAPAHYLPPSWEWR